MLQEIFYWVCNMSLAATVTGLVVRLLAGIPRVPKRLSALLWWIPYVRMVVPVGLNSRYSLMKLLSDLAARTITVYRPAESVAFSVTNFVMAAESYFPITYRSALLETVFRVASLVWIVVALAMLMTLAVLYGVTIREIKDAEHRQDNIYVSPKAVSPGVYGIFRPRIVLPEGLSEQDIPYVLLHERAHIARCDNLLRVAAFAVTALHWFNPVAWLLLRRMLADMELACDEKVLAGLGEAQVREYATVLLNCRESRQVLIPAFGGARLRTRIENILSFKKLTGLATAALLMLFAAVAYALLTNAG